MTGKVNFCNFAVDKVRLITTYDYKEALCFLLVSEKPRKLKSREQELADGSHVTRGAVISTSVLKGFPSTFTLGRGIQFHASVS